MAVMLVKLKFWIERIPWYVCALIILYFVYQIYINAENVLLVLGNVVGAACFAYLTSHNIIAQQTFKRNK